MSVLDNMAERVLTTDGKTAWAYDSFERQARKYVLPERSAKPKAAPEREAYDPQAVAKRFLAAIDPSRAGVGCVAGARDASSSRSMPRAGYTTISGSSTTAFS